MRSLLAKFALATAFLILPAQSALAIPMSYDLGGSSGTINNASYTELHLGLNSFVMEWLNWRNALFTRFGTGVDSVSGLDSSLLATFSAMTSGKGLGFQIFAGPGVRLATANNNAALAEAGLMLRLGGLEIGGGARYLSYLNTRTDSLGAPMSKDETQYFLIFGGGGSF
jgi:hypothetical protein